jgi:DNA polymerase III delta prime subunit
VTTVSATAPETEQTEFGQATIDDWLGSVAHAFLWYGNVGDYAASKETVPDYAVRLLVGHGLQSVVVYSVDRGITFPVASFAEDFVRVTGAKVNPQQVARTGIRGTPEDLVPFILQFLADARMCAHCGRTVKPATDAEVLEFVKTQTADPQAAEILASTREGLCLECLQADREITNCDAGRRQVAAVVIEGMDLLCPPAEKGHMEAKDRAVLGMLRRAGTDIDLENSGNPLIMLAPSLEEVHTDLQLASAGIRQIEVPLPDYAKRLTFIEEGLEHADITLAPGLSAAGIAALTSSMALRHIEDAFLRAAKTPDKTLTKDLLKQRKREVIKSESGGLLKIVEPQGGFERLGGLQEFMAWAGIWIVKALGEGKQTYVSLLLDGPPGTGKTEIAYAIAFMLGWNCFEYGEVRGSLMGETEKGTAKSHQMVEAGLPCVLVMDEVDQMGGRVTSGVGGAAESAEAAVFRSRLQFMEDMAKKHRGEILIVGTSNRPDMIDDAMNSRFEVRVPIIYPKGAQQIASTLHAILARDGNGISEQDLLAIGAKLAKAEHGAWAPRDMVQAVVKARGLASINDTPVPEALERAFATRKPMAREDAAAMEQLAIAECNDLELLPQQARNELEEMDQDELRNKVAELRKRTERAPRG